VLAMAEAHTVMVTVEAMVTLVVTMADLEVMVETMASKGKS